MPVVTFSVTVDGKPIDDKLAGRLIDLTVQDGEGTKSDSVQFTLDNKDGKIKPPRTGVIVNVKGGYVGEVRDFGSFKVDNVTVEGYPQKISVSAQAVDAKSKQKQGEPKGFPKKDYATYGDIFSELSGEMELSLAMSDELKSKANPGTFKMDENPLGFLTRIGKRIGAMVSVKSGRLVVLKAGEGKSASGQELPTYPVRPGLNLISYTCSFKDKPKYKEVEATYYDRNKNERVVIAESTGLEGPKFLIKETYKDEEEATEAARAKARDLVRAQASATFTVDGSPFIQAEANIQVSGIGDGSDGVWRVKTVTHNFSATGAYTTEIECEVPAP